MSSSGRRRTRQPLQKLSSTPARPRRKKRSVGLQDGLVKGLIGLFIIINVVLVFFVVRQCGRRVIQPPGPPKPPVQTAPLQIEVLNGCGVTGVAGQFMDYLRSQGFDVVRSENYESFNVLKTVIIDRRGNIQNALRIARAMGLGEDRVLQEVNDAYLIDASVIVGKDYRRLSSWPNVEN